MWVEIIFPAKPIGERPFSSHCTDINMRRPSFPVFNEALFDNSLSLPVANAAAQPRPPNCFFTYF
jgi:hypothetical protein